MKILVVDDHQALCRLTCNILSMEGHEAVPAYSGPDALDLIQQQNFDLVITDYVMAGMNGLELTHALHLLFPEMPVIMVTAFGPIEDAQLKLCLAKEDMFPALIDIVRECLAGTRT
jgi:CheY-like chemotaxis protein